MGRGRGTVPQGHASTPTRRPQGCRATGCAQGPGAVVGCAVCGHCAVFVQGLCGVSYLFYFSFYLGAHLGRSGSTCGVNSSNLNTVLDTNRPKNTTKQGIEGARSDTKAYIWACLTTLRGHFGHIFDTHWHENLPRGPLSAKGWGYTATP